MAQVQVVVVQLLEAAVFLVEVLVRVSVRVAALPGLAPAELVEPALSVEPLPVVPVPVVSVPVVPVQQAEPVAQVDSSKLTLAAQRASSVRALEQWHHFQFVVFSDLVKARGRSDTGLRDHTTSLA